MGTTKAELIERVKELEAKLKDIVGVQDKFELMLQQRDDLKNTLVGIRQAIALVISKWAETGR